MDLVSIIENIKDDPRNKSYTERGIYPVLQVHPEAKICIIGQAPGKKVEETKIPFNDKSGETLLSWLGITKDVFYSTDVAIVPMDFYYPGKAKTGDLPPRKFIAKDYHKQILTCMPNIQLTILIGQYSMHYYLGKDRKKNLTETVRAYTEYLPKYFPIVHPSPLNFRWQKNNPWFLESVVPELQKQVQHILNNGRTI